jgi:transcriptional regulator with XRE-family HTH domain
MNIGESIKRHRKRLKITREALAAKAGVSERSLYSYEANKQSPTLTQIEAIAKALQLSPSELLDENFRSRGKMTEDDIIEYLLALRYRSDIRTSGIVRIISKVLQKLPIDSK